MGFFVNLVCGFPVVLHILSVVLYVFSQHVCLESRLWDVGRCLSTTVTSSLVLGKAHVTPRRFAFSRYWGATLRSIDSHKVESIKVDTVNDSAPSALNAVHQKRKI